MKLRFHDEPALSWGAAASSATVSYSMNSPYDPYYAVGGGQCSGFSQYASIYDRYICTGCKVTAQVSSGLTSGLNINFGLCGTASNESLPAAPQYIDYLRESPRTKVVSKVINSGITNAQWSHGRVSKYFSVKRVENRKSIIGEDNYTAATTADPTTQPLVTLIVAQSANGATTLVTSVDIVYYVRFYQPKTGLIAAT